MSIESATAEPESLMSVILFTSVPSVDLTTPRMPVGLSEMASGTSDEEMKRKTAPMMTPIVERMYQTRRRFFDKLEVVPLGCGQHVALQQQQHTQRATKKTMANTRKTIASAKYGTPTERSEKA